MFNKLNEKRAQSTLEYAILIVIVIGALISIQMYVKRGLQGRLKSASDDIGNQFSPGNMRAKKVEISKSVTRDVFTTGESSSEIMSGAVPGLILGEDAGEEDVPGFTNILAFEGDRAIVTLVNDLNVEREKTVSRMQEEIIDVEQEFFGVEQDGE